LFSRDTTYRVYLAQQAGRTPPDATAVRSGAKHVLPVAPAKYESLAIVLEQGSWLVSVNDSVLRLRLDEPAPRSAPVPGGPIARQPPTQARIIVAPPASPGSGGEPARSSAPRPDAPDRVRAYLERNQRARLALAFYYREYILGLGAPQTVPMLDVVVAMDLSGEGAVSDYKKLLQGLIWSERGHARDLAGFLLAHGLLTPADLDEARRLAAANERSGASETARKRLRYRQKDGEPR
jgi:hypothetical protein